MIRIVGIVISWGRNWVPLLLVYGNYRMKLCRKVGRIEWSGASGARRMDFFTGCLERR